MQRQLRARSFQFPPSRGILIAKKTGAKRPLVISPIPSRIVQRALLDIIQGIPQVRATLQAGNNFGGIEGLGVPHAVREAYSASRGSGYFIRTDIKNFFVRIPRDRAIEKIISITGDEEFNDLLKRATDTELANIAHLYRHRELFPLQDVGVAQGSCLSPLLANLLLSDFDRQMNGRGVRCIRYIDDFILFAPNRSKAFSALKSAKSMLADMGLDCYNPAQDPHKAESGDCADGFSFLGCEIHPTRVRPARKSQLELRAQLRSLFVYAIRRAKSRTLPPQSADGYLETLSQASRIIRGWGNTYFFCTDDSLFASLDRDISQLVLQFDQRYRAAFRATHGDKLREMLGVFRLAECKRDDEFRTVVKNSLV